MFVSSTSGKAPEEIKVRHVLIICNPNSGNKRGARVLKEATKQFEKAEITVKAILTERAGHAIELASDADLENVDVVCAIGGDGTTSEVVNGLFRRQDGKQAKVCLGLIPCGSGNTMAHDLGITTPEIGIQRVIKGNARRIDIGELSEIADPNALKYYSINIIGFGVSADVMERVNAARCCCGGAKYNIAAYSSLFANKAHNAKVSYVTEKGETVSCERNDFILVQGQITKTMGDKMPFCPDAKFDDGLLDFVIVDYASRLSLINVMEKAKKGTHVKLKGVTYVQVKEFRIEHVKAAAGGEEAADLPINLDGELIFLKPCVAKIIPLALNVIVEA